MKKLIKIFIFILLFCFCFRVDAKTLVTEQVKSNNQYLSIDDYFIEPYNNSLFLFNMNSYYNGYSNTNENLQIAELSLDANVINNYYFDDVRHFDYFYSSVIEDDGFIVAGVGYNEKTYDDRKEDAYIAKIDKNGKIVWEHLVGAANNFDEFMRVIKTNDGSYIAFGYTYEESDLCSSNYCGLLVKYNSFGEQVWLKILDNNDQSYETIIEIDNGHLVFPTKHFDEQVGAYIPNLVELNEDGEIINRVVLNQKYDFLYDLHYYNNYIYAVGGDGYSDPYLNYVVKVKLDGSSIMDYEFHTDDYCTIYLTDTEDVLLAYNSNDGSDYSDYIIKLDSSLNVKWNKEYDHLDDFWSYMGTIYETHDGNIVLLKRWGNVSNVSVFDKNGSLIKTNLIKEKTNKVRINDSLILDNGDYLVTGSSSNLQYITILSYFDKNGNLVWNSDSYANGNTDFYSDVIHTYDNKFIAVGRRGNSLFDVLDQNGNLLYSNNYDIEDTEIINHYKCVIELPDHSYIFVIDDYTIMKLDQNYNEVWRKDYSVQLMEEYTFNFVDVYPLKLNDNNFLLEYDVSESDGRISYSIIVKIDSNGNIVKKYDNRSVEYGFDHTLMSINSRYTTAIVTDNNDIIAVGAGTQEINHAADYIIMTRFNSDLEVIWTKYYKYTNKQGSVLYDWENLWYFTNSIINIDDGRYAISGSIFKRGEDTLTNSGLFFIIDDNGDVLYDNELSLNSAELARFNYIEFYDSRVLADGTIRLVGGYPAFSDGSGCSPYVFDIYYKYDITSKNTTGGSFTVDHKTAKNKEMITVNPKPNLGYIVDKILLKDSKGNVIELHDYTFEMIPDDVEIEVVFRELINPKTGFTLIGLLAMVVGLVFITIRSRKKSEI